MSDSLNTAASFMGMTARWFTAGDPSTWDDELKLFLGLKRLYLCHEDIEPDITASYQKSLRAFIKPIEDPRIQLSRIDDITDADRTLYRDHDRMMSNRHDFIKDHRWINLVIRDHLDKNKVGKIVSKSLIAQLIAVNVTDTIFRAALFTQQTADNDMAKDFITFMRGHPELERVFIQDIFRMAMLYKKDEDAEADSLMDDHARPIKDLLCCFFIAHLTDVDPTELEEWIEKIEPDQEWQKTYSRMDFDMYQKHKKAIENTVLDLKVTIQKGDDMKRTFKHTLGQTIKDRAPVASWPDHAENERPGPILPDIIKGPSKEHIDSLWKDFKEAQTAIIKDREKHWKEFYKTDDSLSREWMQTVYASFNYGLCTMWSHHMCYVPQKPMKRSIACNCFYDPKYNELVTAEILGPIANMSMILQSSGLREIAPSQEVITSIYGRLLDIHDTDLEKNSLSLQIQDAGIHGTDYLAFRWLCESMASQLAFTDSTFKKLDVDVIELLRHGHSERKRPQGPSLLPLTAIEKEMADHLWAIMTGDAVWEQKDEQAFLEKIHRIFNRSLPGSMEDISRDIHAMVRRFGINGEAGILHHMALLFLYQLIANPYNIAPTSPYFTYARKGWLCARDKLDDTNAIWWHTNGIQEYKMLHYLMENGLEPVIEKNDVSREEFNTWLDTLSPEERKLLDEPTRYRSRFTDEQITEKETLIEKVIEASEKIEEQNEAGLMMQIMDVQHGFLNAAGMNTDADLAIRIRREKKQIARFILRSQIDKTKTWENADARTKLLWLARFAADIPMAQRLRTASRPVTITYKTKTILPKNAQEKSEGPAEEKNTDLQKQIEKIKNQYASRLKQQEKSADQRIHELQSQLKKANEKLEKARSEQTELYRLREANYAEEAEEERPVSDTLSEKDLAIIREYMDSHDVVFAGGHYHLLDQLEELYPRSRQYRKETMDAAMVEHADLVFIFHKFMNHSTYDKVIDILRRRDTPYAYLPFKNLAQCQRLMLHAIQKEEAHS